LDWDGSKGLQQLDYREARLLRQSKFGHLRWSL
jgi:hypothetical protein